MKKYLSCTAAIGLACVAYFFSRPPAISDTEMAALAQRFKFQKVSLPEVKNHPPYKTVRQVHPSLERISAWVSSLGASATLADLDGDGLANDLIYIDPRTDLATVAPIPGSGDRYVPFALNTGFWAHTSYDLSALAPMGSLAGDFDEDGAMDVLVYFWGRTPVLYLRKAGDAGKQLCLDAFTPTELVETGERWYSNAATLADLDGDGHVDLLIGNYYPDGARVLDSHATGIQRVHAGKAKALNGGFKHVFLSAPAPGSDRRSFVEAKDVLGDEVSRGWTLALGAMDLDGDLLPEIYIANDFGPDRLLHNRSAPGKLKFQVLEGIRDFTTPKSCVLGQDSFKSMGVDFGDVNGDGVPDIYVSNLATRFGLTESHFVWLSSGDPAKMKEGIAPYVHGAEKLGLARSGFAFEARLADFDNDGTLEAMQACGFIKGKINRWPELQALGTSNDQIINNPRFWPTFRPGADLSGKDCNPFFVKGPDGRFHDITPFLDNPEPTVSRGIAIADVDGDGLLDYVTANQWGPSLFFKNQASRAGAFLGLRLQDSNGSPAIGAVARATLADGRKLIAQIDGGTGHSGHRSPEIHFGLGEWDKAKPVEVEIQWRDSAGKARKEVMRMTPGWHTVQLRKANALVLNTAPIR